eukprot:2001906-Ditylum_brightwellii.AAC.1
MTTGHNSLCPNNPGDTPRYAQVKNQIENATDSTRLSGIHTDAHSFVNRSMIDVLQFLYQMYGSIDPGKLKTNAAKMDASVDPN